MDGDSIPYVVYSIANVAGNGTATARPIRRWGVVAGLDQIEDQEVLADDIAVAVPSLAIFDAGGGSPETRASKPYVINPANLAITAPASGAADDPTGGDQSALNTALFQSHLIEEAYQRLADTVSFVGIDTYTTEARFYQWAAYRATLRGLIIDPPASPTGFTWPAPPAGDDVDLMIYDKLVKVGQFGVGADVGEVVPTLNEPYRRSGKYVTTIATVGTFPPGYDSSFAGILEVSRFNLDLGWQVLSFVNGDFSRWRRRIVAGGAFGPWQRDHLTISDLMETGVVAGQGRYWRFYNGMQVCVSETMTADATTAQGPLFRSGAVQPWTFPAAFSTTADLVVTGGVNSLAGAYWTTQRWVSVTAAEMFFVAPTSLVGRTGRLQAIGRWL